MPSLATEEPGATEPCSTAMLALPAAQAERKNNDRNNTSKRIVRGSMSNLLVMIVGHLVKGGLN